MNKKVRIGIIGTGFARLVQIPAFQAAGAEIVSVASGHLENARRAAHDFGVEHFTDDWREIVRREDLDLISIVTPPIFHHEMTMAALENGKHVLCEKPMAMNAAEALEMTEKAAEKKVLALINHELRFLNARQKAFEMIREGEIGRVMHVKTVFRNASRGTPETPWNWWSDETKGGGALGAIGSHAVDAFNWILGTEIAEIFCALKTNIKERPDKTTNELRRVTSDDEANLILRFTDGELTGDTSATASFSVVEAGEYIHDLEIFGSKGSLVIKKDGEFLFSKMEDNLWQKIEIAPEELLPNRPRDGWSNGFLVFAREIVGAIKAGRTEIPHAATFADGYRTQLILDAARESNAKGCFVKIKNSVRL